MHEVSKLKDRFYIVATSSILDPHRLILKQGETFGVFSRFGDILPFGKGEQGLYHEGTRFLSRYLLEINGLRPLFLSSNVDEDNILITVDLSNPDLYKGGRELLKRDIVHVMRSRLLFDGCCLEHIRLRNFSREAEASLDLELEFEADFADIFEVRGMKRKRRGRTLPTEADGQEIRLSYEGLDGVVRHTIIKFSSPPDGIKENRRAFFKKNLRPGQTGNFFLTVSCISGKHKRPPAYKQACIKAQKMAQDFRETVTGVHTSNELFNESIKKATSDIMMMLTGTPHGLYPYGGIPWYAAAFGRDGIITALQCLWIKPEIARDVLRYLAATQAHEQDKKRASEPGKIIHESRNGEMAALGEIPFDAYYGSVDSTPLFLMLAGAYLKRTGDMELIREIWESIELAVLWMENYGDVDGDGFLEYVPHRDGLINQGWKDSFDSVFHRDGTFPEGPIALCEVQGYAYAARRETAEMAAAAGKKELAQRLSREAEALRENFDRAFWDPVLGSYALALDGNKKPCRVLASNAGHTLFASIARPERASMVARKLTSDSMFSGWGIRTLSSGELPYNPMSYHNGSVWPHDNSIAAAGFSRYMLKEPFIKVFTGMFEASLFMEFQRLPELFCGFHRRKGQPPTLYPVACAPQTWASGSLILMLQTALGLEFDPKNSRLIMREPVLPGFLEWVRLKNLFVMPGKPVDLNIRRYKESVSVEVEKKAPGISITVYK
ncbi:MAG: amylo-alpha-1,6-glucosidase [Nitrospiraceae bacterium]|nr:amylo-alpha-1,6-glucosidase [Nitrospiraceae bacterium]